MKRLQLLMRDVNGGAEKIAKQIAMHKVDEVNYLFFMRDMKLLEIQRGQLSERTGINVILKLMILDFNVVISHFYLTHLLLYITSMIFFRKSKKIFLIHSGYYEDTFSVVTKVLIFVLSHLFRLNSSTDIVYTSRFSQLTHRAVHWPNGRILHNVAAILPLPEKTDDIRRTLSRDVCTLGFVGRDHPDKGIELLIEIIAKFNEAKDFEFRIILSDKRDNFPAVGSNVTFISETDDIYSFLNDIDILIVPSVNENYPMVILEALNAGCHIVASEVGGIPEIRSDQIYLVDTRKPSEWLNLIMQVRTDMKLKEKTSISAEQTNRKFQNYMSQLESADVARYRH